jgi:hypothetical protein
MNKSIHFRTKNVILQSAILFAMLFSQTLFAVTIFSENLGTPAANTSIAIYSTGTAPATFQNKGILTYSNGGIAASADLRATSASSTYAGASGGGNVFFTTTNTSSYGFSIEGINAATYTSLSLSYGYRKESATLHATFSVEYWDGAAWVVLANTTANLFNEAANATTGWYAAKTLALPAGAQINGLKIRFVKSGTASIRIDDIVMSGTASTTGASTLAAGAGAEPATMSSLINIQVASALNFDVLVQDDGATPANDALATQLTQLVFTQGTGNDVANWSLAIAGAELTDGTGNTATGTIASNSITFAGLTALGLIADDAAKTYTLKVWLKTDLTTLKTTIDGLNIVFRLQNSGVVADVAGSQFLTGQDVGSGAGNNAITVVATTLGFAVQPTNTNANTTMTPAVVVSTNDANGNRDIDYIDDISITSSGTLVGGIANSTTTLGIGTFNTLVHSALGTGLVLTASSAPLAGTSTMFDIAVVTAPTDYFRSKASGLWSASGSWESSPDNITWMNATLAPTSAANLINIKSTHDISIAADVTIDQTTVENGGKLSNTAGVITINDGLNEDLVIENGGVFLYNSTSLPVFAAAGARFAIRTNGMLETKTSAGTAANFASNAAAAAYQTNMQWEDKSIFNWNNTAAPSTANRIFFPNANTTIAPILRISGALTNIGSATGTTIINGLLDVRANFSWIAATAATRILTFRNGIIGTATMTTSGTGVCLINGTSAELGGTAGTLNLALGAAGAISVTTTILNVTSDVTTSIPVTLGATAAQTVNGNDFAIGGLTMNNALGATLASPLKVKGALTMTNGLLNTTATNLLKLGTLTTTSGASATSFVNGPVSKDMDATTLFTFPTGKGTIARAIGITPSNTTLTTYTAEFFNTPAPSLTPIAAPLLAVGGTEYFDLKASPTTPATVELMYSLNPGECTDVAHLTLAHFTGGTWITEPATASANSTTTIGTVVTNAAVTSFSPFAIGSTNVASALPIELKSFIATKKGTQNVIQWETASEENLRIFVVEKSDNAKDWTTLTSQTPQITKRYSATDNTPFMPMTYYRLRNIDNDARQAVSKIVVVSSDKVSFSANIVSASKDGLLLNIYSEIADDATLQIVDMAGRIVTAQSLNIAANSSNILDIPTNLIMGVYMVKIQTNNGESFNRLISIN